MLGFLLSASDRASVRRERFSDQCLREDFVDQELLFEPV